MFDHKTLAQALLDAQRIHEESYVKGEDFEAYDAMHPTGEYKKNHYAAAQEASSDPNMQILVYLLNTSVWNDIQEWASRVLGR